MIKGCCIFMGVNTDGLCVITSNVIAWRAYCVIILVIWNDALVFLAGAGTEGSSSIIIGCRVSVLVLVSAVPLLCAPPLLP